MLSGPPLVRWSKYRPHWFRKQPPRHCRAVVCKRPLDDNGLPVLAQVGYISTIPEDQLEDAEQRRLLWVRARYRLGQLRLPPNEIKLIEQQLAQRVTPPEPQQAASAPAARSEVRCATATSPSRPLI
jgi:hypothetical protein